MCTTKKLTRFVASAGAVAAMEASVPCEAIATPRYFGSLTQPSSTIAVVTIARAETVARHEHAVDAVTRVVDILLDAGDQGLELRIMIREMLMVGQIAGDLVGAAEGEGERRLAVQLADIGVRHGTVGRVSVYVNTVAECVRAGAERAGRRKRKAEIRGASGCQPSAVPAGVSLYASAASTAASAKMFPVGELTAMLPPESRGMSSARS